MEQKFIYKENPFIFSDKYKVWRHLAFWLTDAVVFTFMFQAQNWWFHFLLSLLWVPLHMVFVLPVIYFFLPRYLMRGRYLQFAFFMLLWGVIGWFWNAFSRVYIYFPLAEYAGLVISSRIIWSPISYLTMCTLTGIASMIVLFKHLLKKQKDFLMAQKEKATAELQLLKAQIHPHFLFNTLNNIYAFSMQRSDKTPGMITKLSSLLSYVLYDCKANEVLLEKEIEVMKNYIDLEKERYGNKLEISLNIEGDIKEKYIAPLLLLPFIENAFKHGTSEQLEKPWLSMDVSVKKNIFRCKILNSKNEFAGEEQKGIGIENVKKRLSYQYPGSHELKLNNEGDFFVVSLMLELVPVSNIQPLPDEIDILKTENLSV